MDPGCQPRGSALVFVRSESRSYGFELSRRPPFRRRHHPSATVWAPVGIRTHRVQLGQGSPRPPSDAFRRGLRRVPATLLRTGAWGPAGSGGQVCGPSETSARREHRAQEWRPGPSGCTGLAYEPSVRPAGRLRTPSRVQSVPGTRRAPSFTAEDDAGGVAQVVLRCIAPVPRLTEPHLVHVGAATGVTVPNLRS